jgi:hypothetical protein
METFRVERCGLSLSEGKREKFRVKRGGLSLSRVKKGNFRNQQYPPSEIKDF